jgi:hypothetical protein
MADLPRIALLEVLRTPAADPDVDFLREALRVLTQELTEAEVDAHLGQVSRHGMAHLHAIGLSTGQ